MTFKDIYDKDGNLVMTGRERYKQYQAQYREDHREERTRYDTQMHTWLREWAYRILGGKCACCGCEDQDVLVVDHINGGGNEEKRELGSGSHIYRRVVDHQNPKSKYQSLCACCNTLKSYEMDERKYDSRNRYDTLTKELRLEVLYHLGMFCRECGYNADTRALHIDHAGGGGKEHRRTTGGNYMYYLDILNHLGDGYQVLCANCHLKRHRHGGVR